MTERVTYDEFGMFQENASEHGIPWLGQPSVRRKFVDVRDGRRMSALCWGDAPARLVFLHGGAQNAHTWDTVALAMGLPAVCIDLPGHGHSGSAAPHDPAVALLQQNAADVADVIAALAPEAEMVVGMSLGGVTALALSRDHAPLVRKLALIDITPGVNQEKTRQITDFVNGPATFPSFDDLLQRTIQFNPTRSEASLRRGILHNALQRDDGSWVWRHRRDDAPALPETNAGADRPSMSSLWDVVSAFDKPIMLVRGMRQQSVVSDDDEAEFLRRSPAARVERVIDAGHSIQGDAPIELSRLLLDFLAR